MQSISHCVGDKLTEVLQEKGPEMNSLDLLQPVTGQQTAQSGAEAIAWRITCVM